MRVALACRVNSEAGDDGRWYKIELHKRSENIPAADSMVLKMGGGNVVN